MNAHGARGQTALMWAVAQKHPDVVNVLLAHGADVHARSDVWSQMMAVPPHGYLPYNKAIPHGGDTALLFAARVGDLHPRSCSSPPARTSTTPTRGASAPTTLAAHSGFRDLVEFLLDKGADPNAATAGFTALHEAIMRRDEKMVARCSRTAPIANAPLQTWTPTRRSSDDFNFAPELVGATPFWLAARFTQPAVMRRSSKQGADPLFVHHGERVVEGRGEAFEHRNDATTALMAAVGMGGGKLGSPRPREREALTLEAVKLASSLALTSTPPTRTAARRSMRRGPLSTDTVVAFLVEKGARAGSGAAAAPARGKDSGRAGEPPRVMMLMTSTSTR